MRVRAARGRVSSNLLPNNDIAIPPPLPPEHLLNLTPLQIRHREAHPSFEHTRLELDKPVRPGLVQRHVRRVRLRVRVAAEIVPAVQRAVGPFCYWRERELLRLRSN